MKHKKDKTKQISVENAKKHISKQSKPKVKKEAFVPKTNEDLRGFTACLLIKGLPLNVKVHLLKKDLPVTPKSINLSKKDGQRSALVTFKSVGDCGEAFDALKGYSYQGHEAITTFVRPRALVDKINVPTPTCFDFLLDVSNIPFHVTLEELKSMFPSAEAIIQRCRHDKSFKGSCILAFKSKEECDEAVEICKWKLIEGRELTTAPATEEECKALLKELKTPPSAVPKEGIQLKLFNLPYTIKNEDLKKVFPQARNIFLPTKNKEPTGIAILTFKNPLVCKAAMEKAKTTDIQGRKLRAELNTYKPKGEDEKKPGKGTGNRGKFNKDKNVKHRRMNSKNKKPMANETKLNLE